MASTLRFIDREQLCARREDGGFRADGWFGDWESTPVAASAAAG